MRKMKHLGLGLALLVLASAFLTGCGGGGEFTATRQINVVSREDGSGTRGAFIEMLGIEVTDDQGTRDMTAAHAEIAPGTNQVITAIQGNRYAIGYISLGTLNDSVRAVAIDAIPATAENVLNGTYPIFRAFEIVVTSDLPPEAQDFIDFILSAQGQAVVADRGYVAAQSNAPEYTTDGALSGVVNVNGSTSVNPVMERLKAAYEQLNPNVNIQIQMGGSTAGIRAAIGGTAHIGMTSRPLSDSEAAEAQGITIAYDGIVVIVNPDNPSNSLSQDEVRRIFIGEIETWESVIR